MSRPEISLTAPGLDFAAYDRVTSVLDWVSRGELLNWRGKVGNQEANRVSKKALKRGTEVHAWIADLLSGRKPKKVSGFEAENAIQAWKEWADLNEASLKTVRTIEQRVFNHSLCLMGQPDLAAAGEIFDWKVSKRIRWPHLWQANEYCWLSGISRYRIVRLDPDLGIFEELKKPYNEDRHEAFLGALKAYRQWKLDSGETKGNQEDAKEEEHSSESADGKVET